MVSMPIEIIFFTFSLHKSPVYILNIFVKKRSTYTWFYMVLNCLAVSDFDAHVTLFHTALL